MPGFGGRYGDAHGLGIAHLAHHQDVRRLPQGRAQCCREVRRIDADLDLFDYAAQMGVLVLDGVFNGQNMAGLPPVDLMN